MRIKSFKFPNVIIFDADLTPSAKLAAAVIFRNRNCLGTYRKSLDGIARDSGLSVPTVRKALKLLEQKGYISHQRNYTCSKELNRMVYDQTTYHCSLDFSGGFTMIPCDLLDFDLTPSFFAVALLIFQQMGNKNRAWPKINDIAKALNIGRATVCRALAAIRSLGVLLVQHCIKKSGAYTSNSYHRLFRTKAANTGDNASESLPPHDRSKQPQKAGFLTRAISSILSIGAKVRKRISLILASHSSPYTSFRCDTDKGQSALYEDPVPREQVDAACGAARCISPPQRAFAPFYSDE